MARSRVFTPSKKFLQSPTPCILLSFERIAHPTAAHAISMPSFVSSILWVPRGVSARHPRTYDLADPGELERVERLGKIKLDDARRELEALEAQVDGMDIEDGKQDSGDEWADEDEDDDDAESASDSEDDNNDPQAKARKAKERILGAQAAAMQQQQKTPSDPNDLSKYNLDDYDDESARTATLGVFGNIKGVSFSAGKDGNDPHITLATAAEEDAEVEREQLEILPTDNLLVAGKSADDVNMLEVHLFEGPEAPTSDDAPADRADFESNMYVHHDTLLPAMPICLEWLDCRPSTSRQVLDENSNGTAAKGTGSFVAIGTMDNQIEVWDLDVVEGLFPEAILGDDPETEAALAEAAAAAAQAKEAEESTMQAETNKMKRKKKKAAKEKAALPPKPVGVLPHMHTDAVLSLAWNRTHRSLLASSSADGSIKLWDLSSPTCQRAIRSFELFGPEAKIQSIQWNPKEPTVMIAGAWGGHVKIFDTRAPDNHLSLQVGGKMQGRQGKQTMQYPDIEVVKWDPLSLNGSEFYVATSKGQVFYYDSKDLSKPIWTLDAHDGACSALDINEHIPGCFSTGGTDKQTKIWNVAPVSKGEYNNQVSEITLVLSKDFGVGKVFTICWNPDDPCILASSGSNSKINIFDSWTNNGFRKIFGNRIRERSKESGSIAWIKMFQEGSLREKASGTTVVEADDLTSDEE